jgi:hypothetical protein
MIKISFYIKTVLFGLVLAGSLISSLSCYSYPGMVKPEGSPFIAGDNLSIKWVKQAPGAYWGELTYRVESRHIGENISIELVLPTGLFYTATTPYYQNDGKRFQQTVSIPSDGIIKIIKKVAINVPRDLIVMAWSGPPDWPRLHGTPLYVSVSGDSAVASSDPAIFAYLALDTPIKNSQAYGEIDQKAQYWIAFSDDNQEYRKVVLSLPGVQYLEDFTWTFDNRKHPAIKAITNEKLARVIGQLDFVSSAARLMRDPMPRSSFVPALLTIAVAIGILGLLLLLIWIIRKSRKKYHSS